MSSTLVVARLCCSSLYVPLVVLFFLVFGRALPWTNIILQYHRLENDLNVRISERLSVVAALGLFGLPRGRFHMAGIVDRCYPGSGNGARAQHATLSLFLPEAEPSFHAPGTSLALDVFCQQRYCLWDRSAAVWACAEITKTPP